MNAIARVEETRRTRLAASDRPDEQLFRSETWAIGYFRGPQAMTREQVIYELERACRTLRRMKFPKNGAPPKVESALGCHLPEPMPDRNTAYGADTVKMTRVLPTMDDLDHFDRVWPWLFHAPLRDRGLVYVRLAYGMGWRKVGRICDCSHETARYRFEEALAAIARQLVSRETI